MPDDPNPFEGLSEDELIQRLKWLHQPDETEHEDLVGWDALANLLASSPTEGPYSQFDDRQAGKRRRQLIDQAEAALQALHDRARSETFDREPPDPWKHEDHEWVTQPELPPADVIEPRPNRPELETADAGGSGPSRKLLIGGGILAVALVVAIPALFVFGGKGSGSSNAKPLQPATTARAPSTPATTTAAAVAPPAVVHFVVDARKRDGVTNIESCGGVQSKGVGNWHFLLRGHVSGLEGKVATLQGIGPGVAGTYHRVVHGGRVDISKPLPCASPGTHFGIGLVGVAGLKAVQDGAIG